MHCLRRAVVAHSCRVLTSWVIIGRVAPRMRRAAATGTTKSPGWGVAPTGWAAANPWTLTRVT
jgi:hypothetical protein